jgi:heat shock protein HslJ/membrane-bound inhibitor of C-type lysozyme
MLRPICLALVLVAPGAALADRQLTGAITYPERIALPEGAAVAVEVKGIDGAVITSGTFPAPGIPASFALVVPDSALIVITALVHDGQTVRAAPTQVVPAGTGPIDLAPLRAAPFVATGSASAFDCAPVALEVGFLPDGSAQMRWGASVVDLRPESTASGARYGDGGDPPTFVWSKGERATVSLQGVELTCATVPAGRFPLSGGGNEPGWQVAVGPDRITYTGDYGAVQRDLPDPVAIPLPDGWLYAAGDPPMAVLAQHGPAFDDATGMPYPWRLTVMTGDTILTGGGGPPEALLIGTWRFEDLGGQGVPDGPPATLRLDTQGGATGSGGCNRFTGTYRLTAEGLTFGPLAGTRMACAPAAMDLETRVFDALSRTDRFGIDDTGALILYAADTVLARLMR